MYLFLLLTLASANSQQACVFDPGKGTVSYSEKADFTFDAAQLSWFISNESIAYAGGSYSKYGLPRQLAPFEVETFNSKGKIPIFVEAGNYADEPDVIYILNRSADCSFQPYGRQ